MIILGLHYGHDANVSIIRDGVVLAFLEKERTSRVKHAIGIDSSDVKEALGRAGLSPNEIDSVSITSTQGIDYLFPDPENLYFHENVDLEHRENESPFQDSFHEEVKQRKLRPCMFEEIFKQKEERGANYRMLRHYWPVLNSGDFGWFPSSEWFGSCRIWDDCKTSGSIADSDFRPIMDDASFARRLFFAPVTTVLFGISIPGYIVSHHLAHAANGFFSSDFDEAIVLSHDGLSCSSYRAGMVFAAKGNCIFPLYPHRLGIGAFYDSVAERIGLDVLGGAGKLMGLAGWGKPIFYSARFVGNYYDAPSETTSRADSFIAHCLEMAKQLNYDLSGFADPERITDPIHADIAASAQLVFEETMLGACNLAHQVARQNNLDTHQLVLSGGAALNCPTNTRIANETPFSQVHVSPGCSDSGLSLGSAFALYYCYFDHPRTAKRSPENAYVGALPGDEDYEKAFQRYRDEINLVPTAKHESVAAELLAENKVIAWFEGRSELGPRALGHRSILGNAKFSDNWPRINRIKKREAWRPFAPAVLEEDAHHYFAEVPLPSRHMLFTGKVRGTHFPAITHIDGSARIQTVASDSGGFYRLLLEFKKITGASLVLNTSLNGPGMPLVETPSDAIQFFIGSTLDALVMPGYLITRLAEVILPS